MFTHSLIQYRYLSLFFLFVIGFNFIQAQLSPKFTPTAKASPRSSATGRPHAPLLNPLMHLAVNLQHLILVICLQGSVSLCNCLDSMFSGINSPSHLPRRLRRHMSGGGRAWRADGAAASLRHIGREKRAIYRLQTAPRHVSGCGGQCAAECAATGAARRRRGERVALSVVCGRGVKIASVTLCHHEMILTGWGIDLPASASVSPASRFGGIYPLFIRRSISVVSFTT